MSVTPPANPDPVLVSSSNSADPLIRSLLFGLSLPERLVRSAVGVTAGTAKELAEFVVPQAFQNSKSYEIAVRNSLGFLVSGVGTVADAPAPTDASAHTALPASTDTSAGRFIARKAAGNFIDIAGLATLHLSPIWVLAIVSDVAYGSQTYLKELAQELQSQGLIDDASTIHQVNDLFDSVKQSSGNAASAFDQPPLSVDELRTSIDQLRQSIGQVDPRLLIPESEIRKYWSEMRAIATQEQVSLLGVSGAITMQAVESVKGMTQGTLTGLFVAGQIVNRNVFGHYAQSLTRIQEQGLWNSVCNTYEPYVDLAWSNFTSSRKTWTEQLLDPGHVTKAWSTVKGWLSGPATPPPE